MGLFDNATSVTIDGVEVSSISIDGGSIYTKSSGGSREVNFSLKNENNEPLSGADISLLETDGETEVATATTGSDGGCSMENIPEGTYLMPMPIAQGQWVNVNDEEPVTDEDNNLILTVEGDITFNIKLDNGEI